MSRRKEMAKVLGGVWTYIPHGTWQCDDGVRYIHRKPMRLDLRDIVVDREITYWDGRRHHRVFFRRDHEIYIPTLRSSDEKK